MNSNTNINQKQAHNQTSNELSISIPIHLMAVSPLTTLLTTFLRLSPAGAHREPHSPSAVPVSESGLPQRQLSGRPASHHAGRRPTQTQRQLLRGRPALQTRETDGTSQYGELVHLCQVHYSPLRVLV